MKGMVVRVEGSLWALAGMCFLDAAWEGSRNVDIRFRIHGERPYEDVGKLVIFRVRPFLEVGQRFS